MTTIAYKDGVLAADSQVTQYDSRRGSTRKIGKNGDGLLYGATGNSSLCQRFLSWAGGTSINDDASTPDMTVFDHPEIEAMGIIIIPNTNPVMVSKYVGYQPAYAVTYPDGFCAFGTGATYALGAMAQGASAEEAVKIACRFDLNSGGEIHVINAAIPKPSERQS